MRGLDLARLMAPRLTGALEFRVIVIAWLESSKKSINIISFLWCYFWDYFLKAAEEDARFLNLLSGITCFERVLRGCCLAAMLLGCYLWGLFTLTSPLV